MVALDAFSNESMTLGLEVSWTKTKIQDFGGPLGKLVRTVHVDDKNSEVTESFTDFDSTVYDSRLSQQEVSRQLGLTA